MAKAISKAIPKFGSENVAPIKHSLQRIFNLILKFKIETFKRSQSLKALES